MKNIFFFVFIVIISVNGFSQNRVIFPSPCYPPENVTATVVNQNQIELTWDPPSGYSYNGFNVYRNGSLIGFVSSSPVYYEGLLPGT